MRNLLQKGSDWLEATREQHATKEVEFCRASSSVTVPVSIGRSAFEYRNTDGMIISSECRDYLVTAAKLVLDGVPTEPKKGDRFIERDGSDCPAIYEVTHPTSSDPAWRWSDQFHRTYRIHTRRIQNPKYGQ